MSSNLVIKTLGRVEISSGDGYPVHVAPIGSVYTDTITGDSFTNTTGLSTGWTPIIKKIRNEFSLTNNTTSTATATASWVKVSGSGVLDTSANFTYSTSLVTLISSTGDGGFENTVTTGTQGFADNGWIVVNGSEPNRWFVGTTGASGSGFGAYVSNNNGDSNSYSIGSASVVYFYRDVTIPAYVTRLNLGYSIRTTGQTLQDFVRVYQLSNTQTITAGGTILSQATPGFIAEHSVLTGYAIFTQSVVLNPSSSTQVRRITFGWRNNGSVGTQPPASIDRISLTYESPITITYTGSQSTFRSLMTGSFQGSSAITNASVLISKNNSTTSNLSESTYNLQASSRKDAFTVQNLFTMSNGDTISPFINNESSNVSIIVNDLRLAIWNV